MIVVKIGAGGLTLYTTLELNYIYDNGCKT